MELTVQAHGLGSVAGVECDLDVVEDRAQSFGLVGGKRPGCSHRFRLESDSDCVEGSHVLYGQLGNAGTLVRDSHDEPE